MKLSRLVRFLLFGLFLYIAVFLVVNRQDLISAVIVLVLFFFALRPPKRFYQHNLERQLKQRDAEQLAAELLRNASRNANGQR